MTLRLPALGLLVALCDAPCLARGAAAEPTQSSQTNQQGSVLAGKALFTGATRFQNGGPPCAACHSIAGLPFPNGGSVGPDLTQAYSKQGQVGLKAALQTLYFPTMAPIFDARPLTLQEQQDLTAFFAEAQSSAPPRDNTGTLVGVALAGCAALLGMTWRAGRNQPQPVRQSMVKRATSRELHT